MKGVDSELSGCLLRVSAIANPLDSVHMRPWAQVRPLLTSGIPQ